MYFPKARIHYYQKYVWALEGPTFTHLDVDVLVTPVFQVRFWYGSPFYLCPAGTGPHKVSQVTCKHIHMDYIV